MPLLLTYAVTLFTAVLGSAMAHRTLLSTAAFLAVGFVAGTGILGIVSLTPGASAVSQLLEATCSRYC